MKASDVLVKCLEAEGVKYIFGLPGEENEDLLFSLEKSSIKFIGTRHEQGAAFMADVWGRLTGKAGVCLATLGPGATNLITGLADAQMDKSPVVAITGQAGSERLHKESHQSIDVISIFKPIVKWNVSIQNPDIIPESARKAFKLAELEKPGVCHIELPEDIAKKSTLKKPIFPQKIRRPSPDYKVINKIIELLKNSKKPLIIAGNGAIRKLASKHLKIFVEKTNIPVVSTFMGKGAIPDDDKHSLFSIGLKSKDNPFCAVEESDLIIAVGYDIAEYSPESWNTKLKRPIIHIDFNESEVYDYYQPEVEAAADISATLWELNQRIEKENLKPFSDWFLKIRESVLKDISGYAADKKTITVPYVLQALRSVMARDDILISDVGAHKMWIARNFPVYEPGACVISNGFASMGIALPGGFAAKLAFPKRRIISVCGDGGFLMNSQEIETAKRFGVPYTIIILNDNDYGLIKWKQFAKHKKSFGTDITNPDFVKYGESFGIKVYKPKKQEDVRKTLASAVSSDKLNIVAIDIDAEENLRLTEKLNKNICEF